MVGCGAAAWAVAVAKNNVAIASRTLLNLMFMYVFLAVGMDVLSRLNWGRLVGFGRTMVIAGVASLGGIVVMVAPTLRGFTPAMLMAAA